LQGEKFRKYFTTKYTKAIAINEFFVFFVVKIPFLLAAFVCRFLKGKAQSFCLF